MASEPVTSTLIPLAEPALGGNEWRYVKECLDTNWVSSAGSYVDRFEHMMASRIGVAGAVAVVNGTAAIHLGLKVAGVEPDDEVILPALTFIAPANAVRYVGAFPVFLDVDPSTWQLDPQRVADFVFRECEWHDGRLRNRQSGRRVTAILPVDILGHPVDLQPILDIARARELCVVEDATESLGALYRGEPVGRGADVACFSFNGNKIVTTGGGGMVTTNRTDWAQRARYLSTQAKDSPVEYVHGAIGFNYRLTNVLAAIGVAQLEQLDAFVERKRHIASTYREALTHINGLRPMVEAHWAFSTFWLYTVTIDAAEYGADSRGVLQALAAAGIQSRPLWEPLHRSAPHRDLTRDAPVADALYRDALSLPSSVGLRPDQQERVIAALQDRRWMGRQRPAS